MNPSTFNRIRERLGPVNMAKAERLHEEFIELGLGGYVDFQLVCTVFDSIVSHPGLLEKLEAAPVHVRVGVVRIMCGGRSTFGMAEYLDVLAKAGYPEVVALEADLYNMDEFQDALKKASSKNKIYSKVSEEFKAAIRMTSKYESRYSGLEEDEDSPSYYMDEFERASLFILRSVYGEDAVSELLTRTVEEKLYQKMTAADLIPILEDWQNLKDFPLTWTRNLTGVGLLIPNKSKSRIRVIE